MTRLIDAARPRGYSAGPQADRALSRRRATNRLAPIVETAAARIDWFSEFDRRPDAAEGGAEAVEREPLFPSLRALLLMGGCVAATPVLIAQAARFQSMPPDAQGALLVASVCAAAVILGGGVWAWRGLSAERVEADRPAPEPARATHVSAPTPRGETLAEALFGCALQTTSAAEADCVDPVVWLRELQGTARREAAAPQAAARQSFAPCPEAPSADWTTEALALAQGPAARQRAERPRAGGLDDPRQSARWSARWAHARRSAEIARRRAAGRAGKAPGPGGAPLNAPRDERAQDKLMWRIAQMSKSETARRRAEEAATGLRR